MTNIWLAALLPVHGPGNVRRLINGMWREERKRKSDNKNTEI